MGRDMFSMGCNHIGNASKCRRLFDIYKVFNHHLVHDILQKFSKLCRFWIIFCWTITPCLCNFENCPQNTVVYLPPCGLCDIKSAVSIHYSSPKCNNKCSLFGGGVLPNVLSILQERHINRSLSVAFSFVRLLICRIGLEMGSHWCVLNEKLLC